MNARRFILYLGLSACAFAATDALPRTNERSLTFVALDRKGAAAMDLTSADFQIFDEGKLQQITSFRAENGRTSVILIVFDLLNATPSLRSFTSAAIVHALEPLEESDSLYFYILTNQGSLYPIHALPAVRPTLLRHRNTENKKRVAPTSSPWTKKIHPLLDQALEQVVRLRPSDFRDAGMEASTTFRALATVGAQLAPLDRDKSILRITRGTPNMLPYPFGCRDLEFAGESGNYLAGTCRDNCPWLRSGTKCVDYTPFLEHFSTELERSGTIFSSVEEPGLTLRQTGAALERTRFVNWRILRADGGIPPVISRKRSPNPCKVTAAGIALRIRRRRRTGNITAYESSAGGKAFGFRRRSAILRPSNSDCY